MSTESMVTQANYALAEEVVSAANVVSHDGYYEVDIDAAAKTIAAWNTCTAAQPEREAVLEEALRTASLRFTEYAELHADKLLDGSLSEAQRQTIRGKVDRNLRYAAEARAALTTPAPAEREAEITLGKAIAFEEAARLIEQRNPNEGGRLDAAAIRNGEREQGWQPIETLKPQFGEVLGYAPGCGYEVVRCHSDGTKYAGAFTADWVKSWRPLPPPPTGEGE